MTPQDTSPQAHQPSPPGDPGLLSSSAAKIFLTIFLGLCLWGLSFAVFGLPGLFLPAVALTPVVLATLVLISLK